MNALNQILVEIKLELQILCLGNLPGACTETLLKSKVTGKNLAFCIFTSGSTGEPKGVLMEQSQLINLCHAMSIFSFTEQGDVVLSLMGWSFDGFWCLLASSILSGSACVMLNNKTLTDPSRLNSVINAHGVTHIISNPLLLQEVPLHDSYSLKTILFGGDQLNLSFVKRLKRTHPNIKLYNGYGPTETCCFSTLQAVSGNDPINIGAPISNTFTYVLDDFGIPVPVGVLGELFISGCGVARGYLKNSKQTTEAFSIDPFHGNMRLYKTGDLASWNSDGKLNFVGRKDNQLKIRGYRVDMSEIEHMINSHVEVDRSVVIAHKVKERKVLVAYFVGSDISENKIINYLESKLPDYMIPTRILKVPFIPLNSNGKLDKNKLPAVDFKESESEYVAPVDDIQRIYCKSFESVLGLQPGTIGIRDNAFRYGLDSITAIQIVVKIRKELDQEIKVTDVLKYKTVEGIVKNVQLLQARPRVTETGTSSFDVNEIDKELLEKLAKVHEIEGIAPANSLHEGFIYHYITKENADDTYLEQNVFSYEYPIQTEILKEAWERALQTFPGLRLRFDWTDKLIQIVDKYEHGQLNWKETDLSSLDPINQDIKIQQLLKEDRTNHFALEKGNLLRVQLIRRGENNFSCVVTNAHIILCGWSNSILLAFVHKIYLQLKEKVPLVDLQIDEAYLQAQSYLYQNEHQNFEYWNKITKSLTERCDLSSLLPNHANYSMEKHTGPIKFRRDALIIKDEQLERLKNLAAQYGLTLNGVMQYVWHKVLRVFGPTESTVVGTTVSGRDIPIVGVDHSVGLYINTLPLVLNHDELDSMDTISAIHKVQEQILELSAHSNIRLSKLHHTESSASRLFDSIFVFENYPENFMADYNETFKINYMRLQERLDYPLVVVVTLDKNEMEIAFVSSEEFCSQAISRVNSTFRTVLEGIIEDPMRKSSTVPYLSSNEQSQVCSVRFDYDYINDIDNKTLHGVFEEQAIQNPDKVAVIYDTIKYTYKELNKAASIVSNAICSKFPGNNPPSDSIVLLFLDKSDLTIVGILGALKSGCAYCPIDPTYPEDRVQFILKDTKSKVVLLNEKYRGRFAGTEELCIEEVLKNQTSNTTDLLISQKANSGRSLAWIIYTSGTTSKSGSGGKGVLIEHRNALNFVKNAAKQSFEENSKNEVVLQLSNYCFDFSCEQIFLPLLNGYTCLIPPANLWQDTEHLYHYLNTHTVSFISGTPSFLKQYDFGKVSTVKTIVLSGEKVTENAFENLKNPNYRVISAYGITETTVYLTYCHLEKFSFNIGTPMSNIGFCVLDKSLNLVPVGTIGELHVSGVQVSRGYLNREELSTQKFIPNPFQTKEENLKGVNGKLYRSGDLVRRLANKTVDYIGRNDLQVKIRGFRIELAEIESVLGTIPEVNQVAVVAKTRMATDIPYLVGYYTSKTFLLDEDIRKYMGSHLPEHMVPSAFMRLDELPLTITGKLNEKALPDPIFLDFNEFAPARNEVEEQMISVWAGVLGLDATKLGIDDDFFGKGGDSISAIQLVRRLQDKHNIQLTVKDIFKYKTTRQIYDNVLHNNLHSGESEILRETGKLSGSIPLLPIQQWFFSNKFEDPSHFNHSFLVRVPMLNISKLKLSLEMLVNHHDIFRVRFRENKKDGHMNQIYDDSNLSLNFNELEISNLSDTEELIQTLTSWQSNFDIENGPTHCFGFIYGYDDGSARLYFALHHLIVDTVSWEILVEDVQKLYEGRQLDGKKSSYRQWANVVKSYAVENQLEKLYWQEQISGLEDQNIKLKNMSISNKWTTSESELKLKEFKTVLQNCNKIYGTDNMDLILCSCSHALADLLGSGEANFVLEGHGREILDNRIDISSTVGWFTILYPVKLKDCQNIGDRIIQTKETIRNIPSKGFGYSALFGLDNTKLPSVCFNYGGQMLGGNQLWEITNERSGEQISDINVIPYAITINTSFNADTFHAEVAGKINGEMLKDLANAICSNLKDLLTHLSGLTTRRYLTPSDVQNVVGLEELNVIQQNGEVEYVFPANSLQQGMIFHSLKNNKASTENNNSYLVQKTFQYQEAMNVDFLKTAWTIVQKRFPALRLRLKWDNDLLQIIDRNCELDFNYYPSASENLINEIQSLDKEKGYNLKTSPLFRIYILEHGQSLFTCIFSCSHVIIDGWSSGVMIEEVHKTYLNLLNNHPVSNEQDKAYPLAQQYVMVQSELDKKYWVEQLSKVKDLNNIESFYKEPDSPLVGNTTTQSIIINSETMNNLSNLCKREGVTVNAALQLIWHRILRNNGNGEQTVVGTIVSGRNIPISNIESSVGVYINTLPVVVDHIELENLSVIDGIKMVQNTINEVNSYSTVNLSNLSGNGESLFKTLFIFENYPISQDKLQVVDLGDFQDRDYPLEVVVYAVAEGLKFQISFASNEVDSIKVSEALGTLPTFICNMIKDSSNLISETMKIDFKQESNIGKQLEFWKRELRDMEMVTISQDYTGLSEESFNQLPLKIDQDLQKLMENMALISGTTISNVFLSAFYLTLNSFADEKDMVIGYGKFQDYADTIPLRLNIDFNNTVHKCINIISSIIQHNQHYCLVPVERLVEVFNLPTGGSKHPLYRLVFLNDEANTCNRRSANEMNSFLKMFDLCLSFNSNLFEGVLYYSGNLFFPETIRSFLETMKFILSQFSESISLHEINYVPQELLNTWICPKTINNDTLHGLFELQVENYPNNIAVASDSAKFTYSDINNKANNLARYLISKTQLNQEEIVALILDKTENMIISILGVLKAGLAYVPLDPTYPMERINFILSDTCTKLVIGDEKYRHIIKEANRFTQFLPIDKTLEEVESVTTTFNNRTVEGNNLAYIIYTSGSTGNPKGVLVEHNSCCNTIKSLTSFYFGDSEVGTEAVILISNYIFDACIEQMFIALTSGNTSVLPPHNLILEKDKLYEFMRVHQVTHCDGIMPSFLEQYNFESLPSLRRIIVGGEKTTSQLYKKIASPAYKICQVYGVTEVSVVQAVGDITSEDITIGKEIENTDFFILDSMMKPLPIGAKGELYIGGLGISRGYLNLPGKTAEAFVENPFQTEIEKSLEICSKLYKSGDIFRRRHDGKYYYLGRKDKQTKIRGFRLELEEVSHAISSYSGITNSVVLAKQSGTNSYVTYLAAYYISETEKDSGDLCKFLESKLPLYAIPSCFIHMLEFPVSPSGKLNLRALPDPGHSAPTNELQTSLCQIWAEVLGLPETNIGIYDTFFQLGGNSITAIKLATKLSKLLKMEINLSLLLRGVTISELDDMVKTSEPLENKTDEIIPYNFEREEDQVLSTAQQRFWFLEQFDNSERSLYNIPMIYYLGKNPDLQELSTSIQKIANRHEPLRTIFQTSFSTPYQKIMENISFNLEQETVPSTEELDILLEKLTSYKLDLKTDPPIRGVIVTVEDTQDKYLGIFVHHIAFDDWSANILTKELTHYYVEKGFDLVDLPIQYKDYSKWESQQLKSSKMQGALAYWKDKLKDFKLLSLPADMPRPPIFDYAGDEVEIPLSESTSCNLRKIAKNLNVSIYTVLLSGYYLCLHCFTSEYDFVVGTPTANRDEHEVQDLIGLFLNTVALRMEVNPSLTCHEFVRLVGKTVEEALSYRAYPFNKLLDELNLPKDTSRNALFQAFFSYDDVSNQTNVKSNQQLSLYSPNVKSVQAAFDISLVFEDSGVTLAGKLNYPISIFHNDTMKSFAKTYTRILEQLSGDISLAKISYLSIEQEINYSSRWKETYVPLPVELTIHGAFEEEVERVPDNVALKWNDKVWTYSELNEKSNQLAHHLHRYRIQDSGKIIGLLCEKSDLMVISMIAILKTGAAYVAISPIDPLDRIQFILTDTAATTLVGNEKFREKVSKLDLKINFVGIDNEDSYEGYPNINLKQVSIKGNDIAYCQYTSGTTGNPKGCLNTHAGGINAVFGMSDAGGYKISKEISEIMIQLANYTFDASFEQIFIPLLYGHTCVVAPPEILQDSEAFTNFVRKHEITTIDFPNPTMTGYFSFKNLPKLRRLNFGGSELTTEVCNRLSQQGNFTIFNTYGLSEVAVSSCCYKVTDPNVVCLGKPISNTTFYILDNYLRPVPVGAVGELVIGGCGVGLGYLNLEKQTKEKFIQNPFRSSEEMELGINAVLYRTSDLVRLRPDGYLTYLGRSDDMIKLRGFRVQLSEIANLLHLFPGITQAIVIPRTRSGKHIEKYLAAYYVASKRLDEAEILTFLESKLPKYSIPSTFTEVPQFPITSAGKVNVKELPEPFEKQENSTVVKPRNDMERSILQIWAETLGIREESLGINDNFFRLGGDSIICIVIVSQIREKLGYRITVKDIFVHQTIGRLATELSKNEIVEQIKIKTEDGYLCGECPLLPIQEWFFANNFPNPNYWNQAFLIDTPALNIDKLQASVSDLIAYHDSFRLRFKKSGENSIIQYYDSEANNITVKTLDMSDVPLDSMDSIMAQHFTEWQSNFDLENGPIFCVGYVQGLPNARGRIFISAHHLIIDTVSWNILTKSLMDLYNGKSLGCKTSSYRQWSLEIQNFNEKLSHSEKLYWENLTVHKLDVIPSKTWYSNSIKIEQFSELELLSARKMYNTDLRDILFSALCLGLANITGLKEHSFLIESHGREDISPEIEVTETLGWFTSQYPVTLPTHRDIIETMIHVKENLREVVKMHNGLGYGVVVGYHPDQLPNIAVNYLGQRKKASMKTDDGNWEIIMSDVGEESHELNKETDTSILNVTCYVENSSIIFNIESRISDDFTKKLAKAVEKNIINLISLLNKSSRTYITQSDVKAQISKNYLAELQADHEIENIYLANSLQQGMVHHYLTREKGDDAYLVQLNYEYKTSIDVESLKKAWIKTTQIYPSLRLRFGWDEGIVQIIDKNPIVDFRFFTGLKEEEIEDIMKKDKEEYFDLTHGPLFRVHMFKLGDSHYRSMLTSHHASSDGWSTSVIFATVHDLYINPNKFVEIDHAYLTAQEYMTDTSKIEEYWQNYMKQLDDPVELPDLLTEEFQVSGQQISDHKTVADPRIEGFSIEGADYTILKETCKENQLTVNAAIQFAWHETVHLFGRGEQSVVGVTFSGRDIPIEDVEKSVGLYINTLPLIVDHNDNDRTIHNYIQDIQNTISEHSQKSHISLAKVQRKARRVFDSIFLFQNFPDYMSDEVEKELGIVYLESTEKTDYPLLVHCSDANSSLRVSLTYASEIFSTEMMTRLLKAMKLIIKQICKDMNLKKSQITFFDDNDAKLILESWNNTTCTFPKEKTIWCLFKEQVEKTPDRTAVIFNEVNLTYADLSANAKTLANYLIANYKVNSSTAIGLFLDKSELVIISQLAVWRAGAHYCPIDPRYPNDRIQYMVQDLNTTLIIANAHHHKYLKSQFPKVQLVCPSTVIEESLNQIVPNYEPKLSSENLAYIYYTSGSTGRPKGVLMPHKGPVNYICHYTKIFGNPTKEVMANTYNYVFDPFVGVTYIGLLNGNTILLIPNDVIFDQHRFYETVNTYKVKHMRMTPSLAGQFDLKQVPSLIRLDVGGEPLPPSLASRILLSSPQISLTNSFGPTETAINSHNGKVTDPNRITIGKPISNVISFVLNKNLVPVPIGVVGELFTGGVGVAVKYLNNEAMTRDRFIPNPFQTLAEKEMGINGTIYKTGDLVKMTTDGSLIYIGRNDFQVKVRGYRIELTEIQCVLNEFPSVLQSVVILSDQRIIAYYVCSEEIVESDLIEFVKSKLPEFMIPRTFMKLKALPLTINGKIDKAALPKPESQSKDTVFLPRNELELKLSEIWAETLGLPAEQIGIDSNFFQDLGGDSINSIQTVAKTKQRLGIQFSVKDIYLHKTIREIFENVIKKQEGKNTDILSEQGILVGPSDLLPIQELYLNRKYKFPNYNNQSFVVKCQQSLDIEKLRECFTLLENYHDAFSLRFTSDGKMFYGETRHEQLHVKHLESQKEKQDLSTLYSSWQSVFDLHQGPLHTFGYIDGFSDGSSRIFFALHHLIVDVVSWGILVNDLQQLYNGKELGEKGTSYRQWAKAVKDVGNNHEDKKNYWKNILADYSPLDDLSAPINDTPTWDSCSDQLLVGETQSLLRDASQAYNVSANSILLSMFGVALARYSGKGTNHILLEGHGREELDSSIDLTRTLGFFTTYYVTKIKADFEKLSDTIQNADKQLSEIPNNGVLFGSLIGLDDTKLPKIKFNYLGEFKENNSGGESNWCITEEDPGVTCHPDNCYTNTITVNVHVIRKKLCIEVGSALGFNETVKLLNLYKEVVLELVKVSQGVEYKYEMSMFPDFETGVELLNDSKENLFLLPPAHGGAESYLGNIAGELMNSTSPPNLILFNNFYLYLEEKFGNDVDVSYEDLGREYKICIQKIQPKGPYHIFGWSFGGKLALEASRQLMEAGEKVDSITIIDSYFYPADVLKYLATKNVTVDKGDMYEPSKPFPLTVKETKIVFCKANVPMEYEYGFKGFSDEHIHKTNIIGKYFVEETRANNLESILPEGAKVNLVTLNHNSHHNWVKDAKFLKYLTQSLLSNMSTYTSAAPVQSCTEFIQSEFNV